MSAKQHVVESVMDTVVSRAMQCAAISAKTPGSIASSNSSSSRALLVDDEVVNDGDVITTCDFEEHLNIIYRLTTCQPRDSTLCRLFISKPLWIDELAVMLTVNFPPAINAKLVAILTNIGLSQHTGLTTGKIVII